MLKAELGARDFRNSPSDLQGQEAVYSGWRFRIHTVCSSRKGKRRTEQDFLLEQEQVLVQPTSCQHISIQQTTELALHMFRASW